MAMVKKFCNFKPIFIKYFMFRFFLSIFILTVMVFSQPKLNLVLGTGYYNPKIETTDPIPKIGCIDSGIA